MIKISLENYQNFKFQNKNIYIKGYSFINSEYVDSQNFAFFLDNIFNIKDLTKKLKRLNGLFSIIIQFDSKIFLVSDTIRSYPLFYHVNKNEIFVSDNPDIILKKNNLKEYNYSLIEELKTVKSTSLNYTIIDGLFQVDIGQVVEFSTINSSLIKEYYFDFKYESKKLDFDTFFSNTKKVFSRLIDSLNGKMALIPLSGGYDSRLIAFFLKYFNYENVVCFSYGDENSEEVKISKEVSKKLGFTWYFVNYNRKNLSEFFEKKILESYMLYSGKFSSTPHFQDLYAVKYLMENKLIDEDSIFIPGHSGDLLAGSHITEIVNKIKTNRFGEARNYQNVIYDHWYRFSEFNFDSLIDKKFYLKNIDTYLNKLPHSESFNDLIKTDLWDIANRQAKFIVNSVRVYEFFGFNFRLPLWDKQYTEMWLNTELTQRMNSSFYENALMKIFKIYHIDIRKKRKYLKKTLTKIGRKYLNDQLISFFRNKQLKNTKDENNFNVFIDYISDQIEFDFTNKIYNIDDVSCLYYLTLLEKNFHDNDH